MSPIPDRWLNYSKVGQVIPGTHFIACKTPLKTILPENESFTPEDLLNLVHSKGKNLVLVIDLTYTNKYYNKIKLRGVPHVKVFTPGKIVPPPEIISQFVEAVDSCKLGKNDVIAVHCTHGVNRTGYCVCRYMIDKLNFEPQEAINRFNEARGHKIEREEYIKSLKGENVADDESQTEGRLRNRHHYRWLADDQAPERFVTPLDYNRRNYSTITSKRNHFYNEDYYQGPNRYRYKNPSFSARNKPVYNEHYDQDPDYSFSGRMPHQNEYYSQEANRYSFSRRTHNYDNKYYRQEANGYSYSEGSKPPCNEYYQPGHKDRYFSTRDKTSVSQHYRQKPPTQQHDYSDDLQYTYSPSHYLQSNKPSSHVKQNYHPYRYSNQQSSHQSNR